MFKSRGLFKHVPCPSKHACSLPNCIFDHEFIAEIDAPANKGQVYDPAEVSQPSSPPPLKRRRLESQELPNVEPLPKVQSTLTNNDAQNLNGVTTLAPHAEPQTQTLKRKRDEDSPKMDLDELEPPSEPKDRETTSNTTNDTKLASKQPVSILKPVSPPPVARKSSQSQKPAQDEPFHPRRVDHPPLQLGDRDKKIKLLYTQLKKKQDDLRMDKTIEPKLLMSVKELQKLVLDEEEAIAKTASAATYNGMLSGRLTYYKTMKAADYKSWIVQHRSAKSVSAESDVNTAPMLLIEVETGLGSVEKEVAILKMLRTGLHQHEKHGYIVKKPSDDEIAKAKAADNANGGYEKCDRCERRFQVFPGRDPATGQLASGGQCYHHWGRCQQGRYTCCNQQPGARTCATAEHHVFKTSDPARLASLWQFEETPARSDGRKRGPVVFDCEMVYTTRGFELVRLTALSWPTKKTLLDILVQPFGEILDLNTRFSGVTPQMYADAPMYDVSKRPKYTPDEKLQKVKSPKIARLLLFDLLDLHTPLIGHAIENDLNACRVIHPFVIDTVLLYPSIRGLPYRRKLRDLAREHLKRSIQAESAQGHDSKEDSEATGDLARVKVKEKWNQLAMQGFWWKGDALMPAQAKPKPGGAQTILSSPRQRMG